MGNSNKPAKGGKKTEEPEIDPKTSKYYQSFVYEFPDSRVDKIELNEVKPEDAVEWRRYHGIAEDGTISEPPRTQAITPAQINAAWKASSEAQPVAQNVTDKLYDGSIIRLVEQRFFPLALQQGKQQFVDVLTPLLKKSKAVYYVGKDSTVAGMGTTGQHHYLFRLDEPGLYSPSVCYIVMTAKYHRK